MKRILCFGASALVIAFFCLVLAPFSSVYAKSPTASTPTNPPPSVKISLGSGDEGDAVLLLQQALIYLGDLDANNKSGSYDKASVSAVKSFQKRNGLTISGSVDENTLIAIYRSASLLTTSVAASTGKSASVRAPSTSSDAMVWIPTKGGKKYHNNPKCSNMDNPREVTIDEAESLGFTKCKKCYH